MPGCVTWRIGFTLRRLENEFLSSNPSRIESWRLNVVYGIVFVVLVALLARMIALQVVGNRNGSILPWKIIQGPSVCVPNAALFMIEMDISCT